MKTNQILSDVADIVGEHYNIKITPKDMKGDKRNSKLVMARLVFSMIMLNKGLTLKKVGALIERDHSTVINYKRQFKFSKVYFDNYGRHMNTIFNDYINPKYNITLEQLHETI